MVELSSLDVLYVARELAVLEDAYVDKVYELAPGEFLVRTRHHDRGKANLVVRPGAYACLVAEAQETPQEPTSFAGLLRKYLGGLRVRRVEQHAFDRLLVAYLDSRGEPLRLILELFGKGNLVLVGSDEKIVLAQRTETFRDRTVKRGEPYVFPPSKGNPLTLSRTDFDRLAEASERDTVRFLALDLGFGGDLAEELVHRGKVSKERKAASLTDSERETIWGIWQGIAHGSPEPSVMESDGKVRVASIPYESPKFAGWSRTPKATISAAIEAARAREVSTAPAPVNEERERLARQVAHQREALDAMRKEADAWEARARYIYEHYAEMEAALVAAKELVAKSGWTDLWRQWKAKMLPPAIIAVDPEPHRLTIQVADQRLEIDPEQNIDKNAARFYDEAKRIRAKHESATLNIADAEKRLAKEDRPKKAVAVRAKAPDKRWWFEAFRWCYTSEGFLVVGGRDAASNEKLVKKHLSAGDLYFHADFQGAPSCILKAEGKVPGDASIREAAQFGVAYSKAFAQFGSADAFWVRPEQVSKTAESGEFIAKGAFMIRGTRNYVRGLAMEVAVGKIGLGKDGKPATPSVLERVMGGPPAAVAKWSPRHVIVQRGDTKPPALAKELAVKMGVTLDEVQSALPASTVRVAKLVEARA